MSRERSSGRVAGGRRSRRRPAVGAQYTGNLWVSVDGNCVQQGHTSDDTLRWFRVVGPRGFDDFVAAAEELR